jgi:hypothetical protein
MPHPKVKLSDNSGNEVGVTSNALDVNIAGGATIDIGDVDMFLDGGTAVLGGAGAVAAGVLRVTLASDDAHFGEVGTAADIDGTIHGQLRFIANSFSGLATQLTLASMQASLNLTLVGTGSQYSEGDYHTTGIVRNDTLASLVTDDNDYSVLQVNASGALYVDIVDGGQLDTIIDTLETTLTAIETDQAAIETLLTGIDADTNNAQGYLSNLSGTQYVDDANWTDGSSKHLLVGGLYQSSMQSVTDGDVAPFQVDANGVIKVSHAIAGGADGVKTVTSAGTDVVLGGDVSCKKIDIQAQTDNTGLIAVGFTGVDATEATGTGVILYAGDTYSLETGNLNLIYIDSTVSGEGVRYTYFT